MHCRPFFLSPWQSPWQSPWPEPMAEPMARAHGLGCQESKKVFCVKTTSKFSLLARGSQVRNTLPLGYALPHWRGMQPPTARGHQDGGSHPLGGVGSPGLDRRPPMQPEHLQSVNFFLFFEQVRFCVHCAIFYLTVQTACLFGNYRHD